MKTGCLRCEELEPRILYSVDPFLAAAAGAGPNVVDARMLQGDNELVPVGQTSQQHVIQHVGRSDPVLIDPGVSNGDLLLQAIPTNEPVGRQLDVVLPIAQHDGMGKVGAALVLSSLLATVLAWRHLDLLPVLLVSEDLDPNESGDSDEELDAQDVFEP